MRAKLLDPYGGVRRRVVDDHMFDPGLSWAPSARFRLQVFSAEGMRSVAVVSQELGEGPSVVNGAEQYVQEVWGRFCPQEPQPPIWVKALLMADRSAQCLLVEFPVTGPHTVGSPPKWGPGVTVEELAELVGMPVDVGLGRRAAVERAAEPQMVLGPVRVPRLPRGDADADRACRPAGISWWQVRIRQLLPRRGGADCCWYHGGDWHEVSAMAVDLLHQARAAGVTEEDLPAEIRERARQAGWGGWRLEALDSLFHDPIQIDDEQPDRHVNGRHRTQAMQEAGVRRTVIGRWQMLA